MESLGRLRTTLLNAVSQRASAQAEQELFEELIVLKPVLVKIFDVGPRRPQEQREIESGKAVVNGKQIAFNADFTRQVLFLAQQLDCSETYTAGLLHSIMTENPNIDAVGCIEAAIVEHHRRRRDLVDCLRCLLTAAAQAGTPHSARIHARIDEFVKRDLLPGYETPGGRVYLAQELFTKIEATGTVISKVHADRQSAGSNTTVPTAQGGPGRLGYDILTARLDSLKYERRSLAVVLFLIARAGHIRAVDIQRMVNWLSANPIHAITFYVLTTVFAAFETVDPKSLGGQARMKLAYDREIMAGMTKALGPAVTWKDPGLRATVMLRWTLFLTEARHRDTSLENEPGFTAEELESQIWNAVQGGAFSYLALAVLQLQRQRGSAAVPMLPIGLSLSPEQEQFRELPDEEVKKIILHTFETLVRSLITYASSELRKIKQRQEDVVLASTRVDRTRTIRAGTPHISTPQPGPEAERLPSTPPRNDVAVLLSFIGLLYAALPPESALAFWGAIPVVPADSLWYWENMESTAAKLPPFLQWAVWTTQPRDVEMSTALYYMLSGLANGQQCSELTYNFLARGGTEVLPGSVPRSAASAYGTGSTVSWTAIFDLLESWASAGATRPAPAPQQQLAGYGMPNAWQHPPPPPNPPRPQHLELGPSEVTFAQSFLRLLATVVKHSVTVRLAITGNSHFRAIPTLVSLIPLGVPLELKGALFETLSAFCEPGAGPQGVDICKAVWASMERLEVINVRGGQAVGFGTPQALLSATKGVEVELAEVESVYKLYPATIPFLKLLSTLIHSPKRLRMKDRVVNNEPTNTVPEQLGQPYRLPGIGPFISFVLDTVFAKIPTREYLRPSDRWQMNDLCLSFVEQCLASYDLEALQSLMESQQLSVDSLLPFLVHPGYDIMKRLLTGSPLLTSILSYIVEGVEGFEKHFTEQKHFAEQEPFFQSTIVRVLRIVFRVLEIQDVFLDVIIPALAEFDSAQIVGTVHSRSYFTKFDQALSFRPQFVPALASYVAYSAHSELVLLAIKITKVLSLSHAFQNLAAIIERSSESERILTGFRQVMDMESMEGVATAEALAENQTGAGAPDVEGPPLQFEQAIRLAALDLFIQDTDISRPYPDVGHFLLFGGVSKDLQIEDPHALGARRTCIHVILDLVNDGVPKGRGKADDQSLRRASSVEPLYLSLPAFAERCYKVIYQLCIHPKTSEFSMRYLRTHEDFFARQIAAIPATVPETLEEPYIEVLYSDATRVITTVSALSSFLRLRSWIQDLVALELHVLTERGHHKGVAELLEILFGNNSQYLEDPENSEDENLQDFRKVGQSPLRIIEFVQSLNFDWSDSLTVRHVELDFLKQVDLQACLRKDSTGCEIVDRTALLSLLNSARQFLHAQGRIVTQAHVEQLRDEMNYIRESCAVENHRRQVRFATAASFEAWRRLLDMTLAKCFQRLPHDRRENMLFDLLHVLPMAMRSPNVQDATAVLLSEAILSSVTKLREDRRHQIVVQSAGGDADAGSLPAERLYNLLRNILECILDNNHLELVRGNLYAALINYLHLVSSGDSGSDTRTRGSLSISLSSSTSRNGFMAGDSEVSSTFGQRTQSGASALEAGSLSIMKTVAERLVATISRDAIDGTEVWKTVAFMCLDSLVQLSRVEKQPSIISALVRHGLLSNFVTGLKESDARLQSVLKPEPEDLNPLYVYEAKMSLFIRMTQTRAGSERLLEARILPVLAQCDYLDARPEYDQTFVDQDSFLPSAIQRYHQLFMPALQVVNGMLATLGTKHKTVATQVLDFLSSHRDTVVILLKTDTEPTPLSVIEEMHLLVSVCAGVLPLVPPSELSSSNMGFGPIHAAILGLTTKTLNVRGRSQTMEPQTDSEMLDASAYGSSLEAETKFAANANMKERLLRKAIITYLGNGSNFTEPELTLILSPITTTQRKEERERQFSATIPTLGDAIEALSDLCNDLSNILQKISSLSAEIAAKDHLRVDDIRELVHVPDVNLQDLDVGQKRTLVCRELDRLRTVHRNNAQTLLDATEMLMLLLWRHMEYYAEGHHINNPNLKASTARMTRLLGTPDSETFRHDLWRKVEPILQRLDMDLDKLGEYWRPSQEYIEVMRRRLRNTIGLHDDSEIAQSGL